MFGRWTSEKRGGSGAKWVEKKKGQVAPGQQGTTIKLALLPGDTKVRKSRNQVTFSKR